MSKSKKLFFNVILGVSIILFAATLVKAIPYVKTLIQGSEKPCSGPVSVKNTPDGWRLMVGGKPFTVKGVCYQYVPVGKGSDVDIFSCYGQPWLIDGALMKKMGVNSVRFYKAGKNEKRTKEIINGLFKKFGIRSALGHYLGFWNWPPPNYSDPVLRTRIKKEVLDMVRTYKDEDGILFWILGNENNYSFDRGIRNWSNSEIDALPTPRERREAKARIYYSFVNDIAKSIKEIDPNHPVVMGNGELASIYIAKEVCPDVDILGGIVYQGKTFGTYFKRLKRNFGKPNVFIEFGADRYDALNKKEAEDWQAFFLKLNWSEIVKNASAKTGVGNSLGGFIFEWTDEWWKHNSTYSPGWNKHDREASWSNTAYYFDAEARNNMNEEWFGIVGLDTSSKKKGIEKRVPKKAYYVLQSLWRKKDDAGFVYLCLAAGFLLFSMILAIVRMKLK